MKTTDEAQMQFILQYVKETELFFDFGPRNWNCEAWHIHKIWPKCKIIGVEAGRERYDMIRNEFPGTLLYKAVCEKTGYAEGWEGGKYNQFSFGYLNPINKRYDTQKKVRVATITVDELYEKYRERKSDRIFIWADIEGSELRMLQGAIRVLAAKRVAALNLECFPKNPWKIWPEKNYPEGHCTVDQIVKFLKKYGYENYGSVYNQNVRERSPNYEDKIWFNDYLFLPTS